MILIADSGSTKCDWALLSADGKLLEVFHSVGLNPRFYDADAVQATLIDHPQIRGIFTDIRKVFFYGAGCSGAERVSIMKRGLAGVFCKASVEVDHDLMAAAIAIYEGDPLIACILGTGSNSCYYDGNAIREETPSLGYVLGDEGSGTYFGKQLLRQFLYGRLPEDVAAKFEEQYALDKEQVVHQVYNQPNANTYLAGFMPFIFEHRKDPGVQNMLQAGLIDFLRNHVACFPEHRDVNVSFVGSVAYHFAEELRQSASGLGIQVGKIIQKPIDGLIQYYLNNRSI